MSNAALDRTPHTPGPWEVREADLGGLEFFIVPAGDQNLNRAIANGNIEHDTWPIERNRANARLMAAAPDLLAALEYACEAEWNGLYEPAWAECARAAIAKAKGFGV